MDNSNGDARLDMAKGGRTGAPPFFTEKLSDELEGVDCFRAKDAIDGDNKGNKGAAMLLTIVCVFSSSFCSKRQLDISAGHC